LGGLVKKFREEKKHKEKVRTDTKGRRGTYLSPYQMRKNSGGSKGNLDARGAFMYLEGKTPSRTSRVGGRRCVGRCERGSIRKPIHLRGKRTAEKVGSNWGDWQRLKASRG